jgi:hypothetical protein
MKVNKDHSLQRDPQIDIHSQERMNPFDKGNLMKDKPLGSEESMAQQLGVDENATVPPWRPASATEHNVNAGTGLGPQYEGAVPTDTVPHSRGDLRCGWSDGS